MLLCGNNALKQKARLFQQKMCFLSSTFDFPGTLDGQFPSVSELAV
jgi:hypothetical protein